MFVLTMGSTIRTRILKMRTADMPLVSVITVTRNAEKYIEQSINSVINQSYQNIEYLVFDGLSVDSTVQIIKKYKDYIDLWVSEPDESMYDAINKAINRSTGDIVALLNADDRYLDRGVIARVVNAMKTSGAVGIYGDLIIDYGDRTLHKKVFQVSYDELIHSGQGTFVPHPTLFLKRAFIETVGLYNLTYKYAADYDFILRCLRKARLQYCGFPIVIFRRHAGSITASGKIKAERLKILRKYELDEYPCIKNKLVKMSLWIKYYCINMFYYFFYSHKTK